MESSQQSKPDHPCAACRLLHRKCGFDCMLAPYFPANELENFAIVHRVFGASNVTKMLQTVDKSEREDTVKSLVYEASVRIREPIHGCTSIILYLQECLKGLESQLEMVRSQVLELKGQRDQLLSIFLDLPQFTSTYTPDTMFLREAALNNNAFMEDPAGLLTYES